MDRQTAEAQLRKQMGGAFDLQTEGVKEALVATHLRTNNVGEPAKPANGNPIVVRHAEPAVPRLPAAGADEGGLRAALRQAIAEQGKAQAALAEARTLSSRAAERLAQCQGELARFDDLSEQLTNFEVASLNGGEAELPYALRVALQDKQVACDKVERAGGAQRQVQRQLVQAEQRATQAAAALDHAAASVAVCLARGLVAKLDELESVAHGLRTGLASLQLPISIGLPDDIRRRAFAQMAPVQRNAELTGHWAGLLLRLRTDPDAGLAD